MPPQAVLRLSRNQSGPRWATGAESPPWAEGAGLSPARYKTMTADWSGAAQQGPNGKDVLTMQQASDSDRLPVTFTVNSGALLDCNDITDPGEFPEFGTFLEAMSEDGDPLYVEACQDLQAWLDLSNVEVGDRIKLKAVDKDSATGRWQVGAERL